MRVKHRKTGFESFDNLVGECKTINPAVYSYEKESS